MAETEMYHCSNDFSAYEAYKMASGESKRPNSTGVWGAVLGGAALLVGAGAWIFGGTYSAARAKSNEVLIASNANHTAQIQNLLASQIATNRASFENAKAAQDNINITTTQSGSQSTNVTTNALAQAEANIVSGVLQGNYAHVPQEVVLTSKQYCPCPATNNCGCNG